MPEAGKKPISFHRPSTDAVEAAIRRNHWNAAGLVLQLAWKAGLGREEISALTWDQVDLEGSVLRLPDREVPLSEETVKALEYWKKRYGDASGHVAVSTRSKLPLSKPSMSVMTRRALDEVGQESVQLKDLRLDYIFRQIEANGLPYALQVSGVTLTTYKNSLSRVFLDAGIQIQKPTGKNDKQPASLSPSETNERLQSILRQDQDSPAGIALWLIYQMGLQIQEILQLTWDNVDFEAGTLLAHDEFLAMPPDIVHILHAEHDRRMPDDDPHVILTVCSRKPPAPERLGIMIHEVLIRGGLGDMTASDVYLRKLREADWSILKAWVDEHGYIMPADAEKLLGIRNSAAWLRLNSLTQMGYLSHIGRKYYSAEKAPSSDKLKEAIYQLIRQSGPISCKVAMEQLGVPQRQIGYILRNMVKSGELSSPSHGKYALPDP